MPQAEKPKTFSRKQRCAKKATCNDGLASSKIPSTGSQQDKTAAADSEHDPYDFDDIYADRKSGLNQDSKSTGSSLSHRALCAELQCHIECPTI
jgi:hypothetical protein